MQRAKAGAAVQLIMVPHRVGDVSVRQVIEQRGPSFAPEFLFPDWDPVALEQNRKLIVPDCFDEREGCFISSIHTWVVRTRHHTILIDSCAGSHKNRPSLPRFHQLDLPFLQKLGDAGVSPEAVDYVMCTHLHVDHCGWNTRLLDGAGCRLSQTQGTCSPEPSTNIGRPALERKASMPASTKIASCRWSRAA